MFDKKENINLDDKEIIRVKTTERYRDIKKFVKYTLLFVAIGLFLYLLFLLFSSYVFGSFIISLLVSSIIFYNKLEAPGEIFVESRIEIEKDENGKEKMGNYIFNEYKIPDQKLKEFTIKGNTKITYKSKSGKKRNIVEKIDWDKKIIYYPWISDLSDWEFQVKLDTFKKLKERFQDIPRDLNRNEETRPLYHALEFTKMIQDQNRNTDLSKHIEKVEKRIKEIFEVVEDD